MSTEIRRGDDAKSVALREKVERAVQGKSPGSQQAVVAPVVPDRRPASRDTSMMAKIRYAQALADSGLLPAAYRRHPENVLWAIEYGEMLGLSPMTAITGIHVIEGKPTASAALISALVRRAGHKLRVSGDAKSATCEITRADDPDYVFRVEYTLEDARTAGLIAKNTWRQYPGAMLKARAVTQCARDACEEALFGLHYTPEELGMVVTDDGEVVPDEVAAPAADGLLREMQAWLLELFPGQAPEYLRALLSGFCGREIRLSTELTDSEIAELRTALRDVITSSGSVEAAAAEFAVRCGVTEDTPADADDDAGDDTADDDDEAEDLPDAS